MACRNALIFEIQRSPSNSLSQCIVCEIVEVVNVRAQEKKEPEHDYVRSNPEKADCDFLTRPQA